MCECACVCVCVRACVLRNQKLFISQHLNQNHARIMVLSFVKRSKPGGCLEKSITNADSVATRRDATQGQVRSSDVGHERGRERL